MITCWKQCDFIELFKCHAHLQTHFQICIVWWICFLHSIFFFSLRICKLTILEYVAVYSWFLQSTLTGIPLLENSNRVAIQFGASTWVNSMKPTEAELYHSLGDGGEWMKTPVFVQKIWTHDTGVLLFRQTKGSQKKTKWDFSLLGGVKTGLASIYKPIYCRGKRGGGGGGGGVRSILL